MDELEDNEPFRQRKPKKEITPTKPQLVKENPEKQTNTPNSKENLKENGLHEVNGETKEKKPENLVHIKTEVTEEKSKKSEKKVEEKKSGEKKGEEKIAEESKKSKEDSKESKTRKRKVPEESDEESIPENLRKKIKSETKEGNDKSTPVKKEEQEKRQGPRSTPSKSPKKAPVGRGKKKKKQSSDSEKESSTESESDSSSFDSESDSSDDSTSDYDSDDNKKNKKNKKTPAKKIPTKKTPTKTKETTSRRAKKGTPVKKEEMKSPKKQPKANATKTKKEPSNSTPSKRKKPSNEEDDEVEEDEEDKKTKSKRGTKRKKVKGEDNEEEKDEWWKQQQNLPEGIYWKTLEHNGPLFPPPYKRHNIPLYYNKKALKLTAEEEEVATFYAQYLETDHVQKKVFRENYWADFKEILKKNHSVSEFKNFDLFDFKEINKHLVEQREIKKNRSKEEKEAEKKKKQEIQEKYGYALMDGRREKIGNYSVEPPGLFLGRGSHPKAGKIKKRITPADVTINISKEAPKPIPEIGGEDERKGTKNNDMDWKEVVHKPEVTWLAFWKENIQNSFKYVWLAPSSRIKCQADMKKFDTARELHKIIDKIRSKYSQQMKSKEPKDKQMGVVLYFIDKLALRVGNEKDEDTADTVGCCSLRVEHIELKDPNVVDFDFLGKDSMRYQNSVKVEDIVFKNVKSFMTGKKSSDDLFDQITPPQVNDYLKKEMPGLTAKVFRTYNASYTLQKELDKTPNNLGSVDEKILFYNRCNREVAILCNHQRSLPKKHNEQMEKIDEKLQELTDERKKLKVHIKVLKGGVSPKKRSTPTKSTKSPKKKKKTDDDEDDDSDEEQKKEKKLPSDLEKAEKMLDKLDERIEKWNIKKTEKDELKTVALGTSKINYLDPRITAVWAKKHGVPIERLFSKALREKFPWAMDPPDTYRF